MRHNTRYVQSVGSAVVVIFASAGRRCYGVVLLLIASAASAQLLPLSFSVDAGPSITYLSGVSTDKLINATHFVNYDTIQSQSGMHVAFRMTERMTSRISFSSSISYVHYGASYHSTSDKADGAYRIDSAAYDGRPLVFEYDASMHFNEIVLEQTVRVTSLFFEGLHLDAGIGVGFVISHGIVFSKFPPRGVSYVDSNQGSTLVLIPDDPIGATHAVWNAVAGIGYTIPLGDAWGIDVAVRGRWGMNPFFSDNKLKLYTAIEPGAGIVWRL